MNEIKQTLVQYWQKELSVLGKIWIILYAASCLVILFSAIWVFWTL